MSSQQTRQPSLPWWAGWSFRLWSGLHAPKFTSLTWFNVGVGCIGLSFPWRIFRGYGLTFWPWNAFNRAYENGDWQWGFGVLQVGHRHLFFVSAGEGRDITGVKLDVAFIHVVEGGR